MGGVEYVAQLFGECAPGSTSKLCDLSPDAAWKVVAELAAVMALRAGLTGESGKLQGNAKSGEFATRYVTNSDYFWNQASGRYLHSLYVVAFGNM
jgi:hypothetical protein